MARRRKRKTAVSQIGLSFLDCICCGFGAVILLFVLTMGAQTRQVRGVNESLEEILQKRLQQLATYQNETEELTEKMTAQEIQLQRARRDRDSLAERIADLARNLAQAQAGRENLIVELEQIRRNIDARQRKLDVLQRDSPDPVGLPVESNHIIIVIDTSGSMRNPRTGNIHEHVIETVDEVLRVYPRVEGIQIFDSSGNYVIRQTNGRWLEDSTETRNRISQSLRAYPAFSVSNPVPGIIRAIRTFADPSNPVLKLGIYFFGDEFGGRIEPVLDRLESINPRDDEGNRLATINGIGFPMVMFGPTNFGHTGIRYANLMREISYAHDGAFIALSDQMPMRTRIQAFPFQSAVEQKGEWLLPSTDSDSAKSRTLAQHGHPPLP